MGCHSIAKEWQQRPLETVYAVVFLDAIHYHVRSEGQIVKKTVYVAIGVDLDGKKDVLGMWIGENESAKFLATVLNSLKNRGVEDIFIACTDNLSGISSNPELHHPSDAQFQQICFLQGPQSPDGRPQVRLCGGGRADRVGCPGHILGALGQAVNWTALQTQTASAHGRGTRRNGASAPALFKALMEN